MKNGKKKKKFLARHAKSSAALVSLGIHAVLIVVALSFVAVTVIQKDETKFEAKQVKRPRMQLKRLQVPVKIKKSRPKPKLRKRIVVQPKLNQTMPDIKMPEITGVKGGIGSAGGMGLQGAGGIGFTMPELNLFGAKSRGEKVFIILDTTSYIMADELGGIPAYTLIKDEITKIVSQLPSVALFNVAVFDGGVVPLFPSLAPATPDNIQACRTWLEPLNTVSQGMGDKQYGTKTLGEPGDMHRLSDMEFVVEPLEKAGGWLGSVLCGIHQQADTVYVLTCMHGRIYKQLEAAQWKESERRKYNEAMVKATELLKKENEERRKRGEAPRVLGGTGLVKEYFPNVKGPPVGERYTYTPDDLTKVLQTGQRQWAQNAVPVKSGLSRSKNKNKNKFSLNVIQFTSKENKDGPGCSHFRELAKKNNGTYRMMGGLDAIESYIKNNVEE